MSELIAEHEKEVELNDDKSIKFKFEALKDEITDGVVTIACHDGMEWNYIHDVPGEFLEKIVEEINDG